MSVASSAVQQLLEVLSPLDYLKRHRGLQDRRHPGSGMWLLQHDGFRLWHDISSMRKGDISDRTLCCYGIPGSGKTFIRYQNLALRILRYLRLTLHMYSSMVIDYLIALHGKQNVAYIYCDYRDQKQHNLGNIVGSILKQLLTATSTVPDHEVVRILESIEQDAINELVYNVSQVLKLAAPHRNGAGPFICIDALDELEPQVRLKLLKALQTVFTTARIFLTARPDIKSEVDSILEVSQCRDDHEINIIPDPAEVRSYLSHEIALDMASNPDDMNEQLKEQILDTLMSKATGM